MTTKKSIIWRIIHTSAEMRVFLYFVLFMLLITVYTLVFHTFYPVLEGKTVNWAQSFMFVVETITTTGYGDLLPFHNETMMLFSTIMMFTGVIMIFMVIPLLLTPYLVSVLRSAPPRNTPHELFGHTVIIGNGELSRALVESLMISDKDILLVEKDENTARELAKKTGGMRMSYGGNMMIRRRGNRHMSKTLSLSSSARTRGRRQALSLGYGG